LSVTTSRRRVFVAVYVVFLAACLAVSAVVVRRILAVRRERVRFEEIKPIPRGDVLWPTDPQYVVDEKVGWRPRPNFQFQYPFKSNDGKEGRELSRRHNDMGFLDEVDWSARPPGRPCVLLVGDSHMMGVVSNKENAAALLQDALAPAFASAPPSVINGASGSYSLYQYYLRAAELADVVRPKVLVVVVYMGNDFHEMEDTGRPHLDDELRAQPAGPRLFTDRAVKRLDLLGLPADLNNQGTNQASYFAEMPERREKVLAKAGRTVELIAALARDRGFETQWVLLPSYDMVFPEVVRRMSPRGAALMGQRLNDRLDAEFSAILSAHGQKFVDLLPVFKAHKSPTLYAGDYHIWQEGHRLLADAVAPELKARLSAAP
jgi:hypothetical protein